MKRYAYLPHISKEHFDGDMLSPVDPFGTVDHDPVDQFVDRGRIKLLQFGIPLRKI